MPCYTIRQTPVVFENVAYRPAHMPLMLEALAEMGFEIQADPGRELVFWPAGSMRTIDNTIQYRGGTFRIPSTTRSRFSLDQLKEAYARQVLKLHAHRNGWLLRELSKTEFEVVKR